MSAQSAVRLSCDAPNCTRHTAYADTWSATVVRNTARRNGWVRRHHGETQIDLCPKCARTFKVEPINKGGRPTNDCRKHGGPRRGCADCAFENARERVDQ